MITHFAIEMCEIFNIAFQKLEIYLKIKGVMFYGKKKG